MGRAALSWTRRRASYANVVATLCLFLLLGGGAYAATQLPANSVGTKQLKASAVTGAKVKNGSLTGADVQASTLGQVTSAATAGSADSAVHAASADSAARAGDAATLGGLGPSAYYPASGVRRLDFAAAKLTPPTPILSLQGFELRANCSEGGLVGSTILELFATSSAPGATIDVQLTKGEAVSAEGFALGSSPTLIGFAFTPGGGGQDVVGTLAYADASRTISVPLEMRVTSSGNCQLSGTAIASPA